MAERISMNSTAGLAALAIVCAVAPISPGVVERVYSNGVYAALQPVLTSTSNLVPIALVDPLILLMLTGWVVLGGRDLVRASRDAWWRSVARIALRTLAWSAAAYLVFLVMWGFNYRRVRLVDKLEFSGDTVTSESAVALGGQAVEQMNDLHQPAHERGWGSADTIDRALAEAFDGAVRDTGGGRAAVARPAEQSLPDSDFLPGAGHRVYEPVLSAT